MPTKIILTCFDFPPNEGIGGRRWAKFAKKLAQNGHHVFVIKAKPKSNRVNSQWSKDVQHENIKIHELDRAYPLILSNPGNSLSDRIKYKLTRKKFLRKYKGTIYDDSLGMEDSYNALLRKLIIKEKIQNIIVTGAPFNLMHYTAKLKSDFPDLNLIGDYRDPWIDATNYGMLHLSDKRRNYEISKQQYVFNQFDFISFPSESLKAELLQFSNNEASIKSKFKTLTHFYDLDDFDARMVSPQGAKKIVLTYGGTLYQGTSKYLKKINEALDILKDKEEKIYKRLELHFYTAQREFKELFSNHSDLVSFSKPIGSGLNEKLKQSDGIFIFLGEHNKNFQTTKFMECLPFGKPMIYAGPKGQTSELIESKKLGFSVNTANDFIAITQHLLDPDFQLQRDLDITQYSLTRVTADLEKLLV